MGVMFGVGLYCCRFLLDQGDLCLVTCRRASRIFVLIKFDLLDVFFSMLIHDTQYTPGADSSTAV